MRSDSARANSRDELVRLGYTVAKVERLGLSAVTETEFCGYHNWICVQQPQELRRVRRSLRVCALLPCIPFLHPLTRPRSAGIHLDGGDSKSMPTRRAS